jgi:tetratricopeptide (TPR) repeat protein
MTPLLPRSAAFRFGSIGLVLILVLCGSAAWSQSDDAVDLDAEEAKQAAIAQRFASILEKNPRRGTAFDRVYGFHVEFGSLDKYVAELRERAGEEGNKGAASMILGLIEAHRGADANAVDAFRAAESQRPDDPLPAYYLGQSLLLIGQPQEAVEALERAIERKPERADLLEIYQQLGRMHQRAQRDDEALKVWARLEAQFPNDPRVLEQIAAAQVDEGKFVEALPRYERLVELVKDDYRKTTYRMEVAALKIRSNNRTAGLADLETLLGDLNPDGWLHREVRRRIEEVFLRSGDQDGLVKYYQGWLEKHPQDVDGMARLAKYLASTARVPEAGEWLEKAIKLAPKRSELRRAFISQLLEDQRYADAVQQYALLAQASPGDADVLREWGRAVLKDKSVEQTARVTEAKRIWSGILEARPDDALTTSQVADLFRQSNLNDEATALYEKAVAQAPNDPQYREYLGEFYHVQKQPEKALETWKQIAAGDRKSALNLSRVAEVLSTFGYAQDSTSYIAEAAALDPKDLSLQVRAADYHARAEMYDKALEYNTTAAALVANDDEREQVLKQRISVLQSARRLEEETEKLAEALHADANATAEHWLTLARYYEADRKWSDASETIATALQKSPQSTLALTAAARIAELSGDFQKAADLFRQLAASDRRARGDHLMNVARLESQLGRSDEALAAGRELIVSAPGNTAHYEFYAQLCFRLGKMDEGLETLRKAVRINPGEAHLITALAAALAEQFKADEAIQVYWQAFEKSEEIDDKTSLIMRLTDLHLQLNQFERLIERLDRDRREEEQRRMMTICIAQAHQSAGDVGTARTELESLLSQETRDTELLLQLSKLCEQGRDLDAAIDYQRQIVAIAPAHEAEFRMAGLLQASGDVEGATEIFVKLTQREEDPARLLRSIDSLLTANSFESVIAVTEPLLRDSRDNWELIYREGVAWASLNKKDEARDRFRRILSLQLPHDTLGVRATAQFNQAQAKAKSANLMGASVQTPQRPSPLQASQNSSQVRQAVGIDYDRYSYSSGTPRTWAPDTIAQARMACIGWELKFAQAEGGEDRYVESVVKAAQEEGVPREAIYDELYLRNLQNNYNETFHIARRLADSGGPEEQAFFLQSLSRRTYDPTGMVSSRNARQQQQPPMAEADVDLMLKCYTALRESAAKGKASSSTGMTYQYVGNQYIQLASSSANVSVVARELRWAGRDELANQLVDDQLKVADTLPQIVGAISLCASEKLPDRIPALIDRWKQAALDELAREPKSAVANPRQQMRSPLAQSSNVLAQWMGQLAEQKNHPEILHVLDVGSEIGVQEAKIRRSSRKPSRSSNTRSSTYIYYWYGTRQQGIQLAYPAPSEHFDQSQLTLLRQAFEVFRRNDVLSDLTDHLKKQAETAPADDIFYRQLAYGYTLWWQDEQDEAVAVISKAAALVPDDPEFRIELALLHQQRNDFDAALSIVDSITPRDQKLLQTRETLALQLAERLGETDRARAAAERLFGLRLDADSQLALAATMKRLGLQDMAEAITARVQKRSGNSPSALLTLMLQHQGQGRMDLAEQLAHSILQRSPRPNASMAAMIASGRMSSGDSATRLQALKLLHQTGALNRLIERTEAQLAAAPKSAPLYEQLLEYHGAANNRDKVRDLLLAAVEQRPDSPELRVLLASQLQQSGKTAEACDQYVILLKEAPDRISDNFYQVQNLFQQAGREGDLAKAMLEVDLKRFRQPYYAINVVSSLLSKEASREYGIQLFERCFNEFPNYRNQLIGNLHDDSALKDPRVFDLVCKCLIPSDAQVVSEPWYGFDQITSYSSGGQANGMVDRLLAGSKGSEQARNLRTLVAKRLETAPGWNGGRAMIAVLDIHEGNREVAVAAIQEIFPADAKLDDIPMEAMWLVAQQIDQDASSRDLAIKLFEQAMKRNERGLEFQYGPGMRLVKLYQDRGEKDRAREVLLMALKSDGQDDANDPSYQEYQRLRTEMSVANSLLKSEFPADALRVYRNLVNHPERIELGSQVYGTSAAQQADQQTRQARNGLTAALTALKKVDIDEAVTQLLQVDEQTADSRFHLDLLLIVPDQKQLESTVIHTPLSALFDTLADAETARTSFASHLSSLRDKYPDDPSIGILAALWSKRLGEDEYARDVASLVEIVRRNPLEPIPGGTRPNARQRTEAANWIGLWLVARECKSPDLITARTELGRIALAAASRQVDRNASTAILYDWGKLALGADDRPQAEQLWTELLESATIRPKASTRPATASGQPAPQPRAPGKIAAGAPQPLPTSAVALPGQQSRSTPPAAADDKSKNAIPPLTISQFRIAMLVARSAATNKFPALSQKAVRDALSGGMPVPDAPTATNSMSGMVVRSTRPGQSADAEDPLLSEVAIAIRQVVNKWEPEDFPPDDVYNLLEPIVFPVSRPGEILLYPDHSGLRRNIVTNLGIEIVKWADRAGRTSDLQKQIDARRQSPPTSVAAAVLDCEQALLKKDYLAATAALKELDRLTSGAPSQATIQLAAHAAIRAFRIKELRTEAAPLLKRALLASLPTQPNDDGEQNAVLGPLSTQLNRYFTKSGNTEAIREFYESFATARQQQYARYSGDYGAYQLWNTWIQIANDAAENGAIDISLDYLGRASDTSFENYGRPSIKNALAANSLVLAARSASDRYTQLRDWTLPAPQRETIRVVVDTVSPTVPPQAFLDLAERTAKIDVAPLTGAGPLSNVMQLIDAAEACGSLPELCERLQPLREKKVAFADSLLALALIRAGRTDEAAPIVDELFKTRAERGNANENKDRQSIDWVEYFVWREVLKSPPLSARAVAELSSYTEFVRSRAQVDTFLRILRDFADHQRRVENRPDSIAAPEFVHWLPALTLSPPSDNVLSWWTVSEEQIAHLSGHHGDMLYYRYPIEGDFQFEIDVSHGPLQQAAIGFGGVIVTPWDSGLIVGSAAGHESIMRSRSAQHGPGGVDHFLLRVANGRQTWFLNGQEVYAENLAAGSPWLHLQASQTTFGSFRNLRFSGEPRIPREVALLGESSMNGWVTSFLGESQPVLRKANEKPDMTYDDYGEQIPVVQDPQQQYHWSAKNGVLNGQSLGEEPKPGWTYYHRPLDAGEFVQFEFFHAPGEQTAAPTFGRFAFLLEPDGVRTRWINRAGWDDSVLGVPTENAVHEAALARTDGPLPLKANDWNTVAIAATKETVSLSLNGTLIFERPIEADNPRMVGIYRPKEAKTQVRKVVLSGNWPEKIEGDLLALVQPLPPEERRLQSRLLDDELAASRSIEVVSRAREQDDATAYETLRNWVLPSDDHADIRIAYQRAPLAPAGPIAGLAGEPAESERICPAWELVQVAGRLNRLDELKQAVSALTTETVVGDPARREALLVLIDVTRQDDSSAVEHLAEIEKARAKNSPAGELDGQRAPEVMAISIASQRPGPVATAADVLARAFRKQAREDEKADANWLVTTEVLTGLTGRQNAAASDTAMELRQWSSIPVVSAATRANGLRPGVWSATRGEVVYYPGESLSQLVYRSPVVGRFQVHGTLSTGPRDEMLIGYGHFAARPGGPDLKNTLLYRLPISISPVGSELTIPGFGESARFRIEVDGGRIATFVNDVRIHEQRADPAPSPWLVLQPSLASSAGRVSDLRITGEPQVPETVDLLRDSESSMWTADYFGESASLGTQATSSRQSGYYDDGQNSEQPAWARHADELIGNLAMNRAEKSLQSLVYYRRPLLEDGELDYEMFYVPGEFEIHPAVGRTVVQIMPERIARHILTDGDLDRSGLAPDNSAPIEGASPGAALKPNDWNQVKLRLKGDELTVLVNDAEVARLTLTEPPSQRFFGLFRYADQQKSRVRNLSLRGDWPKSVSSPNEQELAAPDQPKAARAEENSPAIRPAS